jgi:hypothetical protein
VNFSSWWYPHATCLAHLILDSSPKLYLARSTTHRPSCPKM